MTRVDIINKLNWKKKLTSDEREVCHTQAALFELCQNKLGCDAFDFVDKFMQSDIAEKIDIAPDEYYEADPFILLESLPKHLSLHPKNSDKSTQALHWMGYLYRHLTFMGVKSREALIFIPVEMAYEAYPMLHTLDVREAISLYVERSK